MAITTTASASTARGRKRRKILNVQEAAVKIQRFWRSHNVIILLTDVMDYFFNLKWYT